MADLAGPELKLAGLRFNPERFAPSQSSYTYDEITVRNLVNGEHWKVGGIPAGKIHMPSWAPDSQTLVFVLEEHSGLHLWSVKADSREAQLLSPQRINGVLPGGLFRWCSDGKSLLTRFVVERPVPEVDSVPAGPIVRQTSGEKAPIRTFQDLLKDVQDANVFHYYAVSQLSRVWTDGTTQSLGDPAVNYYYESSPDGRFLLQRTLQRPYSYLVPYSRFAGRYDLLDKDGNRIQTLAEYPASEELPKGFDSVRTGRREFRWRDDVPATLVWVEALDGGDMKTDCPYHDRLYTLSAPFSSEPEVLMDLEMRFHDLDWGHQDLALIGEWRYSDRKTQIWSFSPSQPSAPKRLFVSRSFNDQYRDPGSRLHVQGPLGTRILATIDDGTTLLLAGRGASPEGNIPFLDSWNSQTGKKARLWQSEAPYYERVIGLLDKEGKTVVTLRESTDEPPNFFTRDLLKKSVTPLTELPHPTPEFQGLKRELISYKRKDGVDLSGLLYLPPDYEGGKVPVVMWAYPLEYKDPTVAGQVTTSPYEFHRVSYWGPLPFLAMGCAVLDDPKMPIIGEGDHLPNDTFRQQLLDSAEAAVEALVDRGICDRERVAIGGHSYGAFMVANLLAHSDLFCTGIARSGAYNRTLTPFGFQGEERDFWEGQSIYSEMSPFFHADKLDKPLLIIHGSEDNNSGTFPMQSERFFGAIQGLGGQARLVMFPKESHVYRARETLLHMLWEQQEWLQKYLLKPPSGL
jgi:dipeptidyl aminopeptidase/acylaminoacyl peptidase